MATAKIEEKEGIVLSRIPQKEHDAMVKAIGEDGFFSFYSRGALKMGTSAGFSTQELTLGRYNLIVSSSGSLALKEGRILNLYEPKGGLEGMLVASLCLEYALKAILEEDGSVLYPYLKGALDALSLPTSDPYSLAIMFLAKGLSLSGYGLEVGHCLNCGNTKNIVRMDLVRGGFLCQDCIEGVYEEANTSDELKIYRHAFKAPQEDFARVSYPSPAKQSVLIALLRQIHDTHGVRLKSLDPLLDVSKRS